MNITSIVQTHLPYVDNKFYTKSNSNKRNGNIFHSNIKSYLVNKKNNFYNNSLNSFGFNNFRRDFLDTNDLSVKLIPILIEHDITYKNIKGKLDAIFECNGKKIIVEWKTTIMDYIGFGFGVSNITRNIRNCNYHRAILQTFLYKNIFDKSSNSMKIDEVWIIYFNNLYDERGGFCISKINCDSIFNEVSLKILDNEYYFIEPLKFDEITIDYNGIDKIYNLNPKDLSLLKNYIGQGYLPTTSSIIMCALNYQNIDCRYKDDFEIIKFIKESKDFENIENYLKIIDIPEISNAIRMYIYNSNLCIECCISKCKKLYCRKCNSLNC